MSIIGFHNPAEKYKLCWNRWLCISHTREFIIFFLINIFQIQNVNYTQLHMSLCTLFVVKNM